MFKEAWPSVTWGVVDYKGTPKMGFEAMKNALNPTLASIEWKKNQFKPGQTMEAPVWLVNDHTNPINGGTLKWRIYDAADRDKKSLQEGKAGVDSPADSSRPAQTVKFNIPATAQPGQKWVMEVAWSDSAGKHLSKNAYMFGIAKPQTGEFRYEPINPQYPAAG